MARTTGTASLADLIREGKLKVGEKLVMNRRSRPSIEGTLERDGTIRVGGKGYSSPSTAAKHALGVNSVDGWLRWRVPRLGQKTLNEVRSGQ